MENKIIGDVELINSVIHFAPNTFGNVFIATTPPQQKCTLTNVKIYFSGNNSLVFINSNNLKNFECGVIPNNSTIYIGKSNFLGRFHGVLSEEKSLFIGDDCLFSHDIWFRNADPHLIYDTISHERLNPSKSIFIGDHVWMGQECAILKNSKIGSGSIIGTKSLLTGKTYNSNCTFAGSPAKKIKENVFWTGHCVHYYKQEETQNSLINMTDSYTYSKCNDSKVHNPEEIIDFLDNNKNVDEKIEFLKNISTDKNRFYL